MEDNVEDAISEAFTKKGLQHLIDRAHLRYSMAEMEGDSEESTMGFAELMAMCQLVEAYGWQVKGGIILGDEDD